MRGASFRFLSLLFCLEAGLVLLVAPWRPIWDRVLAPSSFGWWLWTSSWVRAAVSGVGAVLLVSVLEQALEWRRAARDED